jgi:hypothetical protein
MIPISFGPWGGWGGARAPRPYHLASTPPRVAATQAAFTKVKSLFFCRYCCAITMGPSRPSAKHRPKVSSRQWSLLSCRPATADRLMAPVGSSTLSGRSQPRAGRERHHHEGIVGIKVGHRARDAPHPGAPTRGKRRIRSLCSAGRHRRLAQHLRDGGRPCPGCFA